jgi:arylsulfatase A-like enzyme
MITGRDAHLNGIPGYSENSRLKRDERLFLGSLMNQAGYQTCMIGKRHWHTDDGFWAGFQVRVSEDEYHQAVYTSQNRPTMYNEGFGYNEINPILSQDPARFHSTDWYVDRLLEYFKKKDPDKPFFAWLSVAYMNRITACTIMPLSRNLSRRIGRSVINARWTFTGGA